MPALDNAKREAFCRHLVAMEKTNGSEAARLAGFAANSAGVTASRLLKDAKISARIEELTANALAHPESHQATHAEVMGVLEQRAEQIVKHVEYSAKSDIGELADLLNMPSLRDLPEHIRYAIHSIDITEVTRRDVSGDPYVERTYKFRLHDKLGAAKLWLQKYALIAPAQANAKKPGDSLPEGDVEITMDIPKASG